MSRRGGACLRAGTLVAMLLLAGCRPSPPPMPNVVLVSLDTLRADRVGAYGYERPTTPSIDDFARDAILFERCIAQAPSTLLSHASILTSLWPGQHGASIARQSQLAPGVPTLAGLLHERGYRTASFNGGLQLDAEFGLDRGFDLYWSAPAQSAAALVGPEVRLQAAVDEALAWLDGGEGPFFLFLHSYEIHHPYTPDPGDLELLEPSYSGDLPPHISLEILTQMNGGARPASPDAVAHVERTYEAELRSADRAFGALLDALRERGLYDDTVVVFTSDHGEEFGERGKVGWHSHTLHDELVHVPLLVKLPASRQGGTRVGALVRGIDIAPTVLAAVGIEVPEVFAGRDIAPGSPTGGAGPRVAFSARDVFAQNLWSIRTERWMLNATPELALYDLEADAAELHDVAARHPEVVEALARRAEALLAEQSPGVPVPAAPSDQTLEQLRELGYIE